VSHLDGEVDGRGSNRLVLRQRKLQCLHAVLVGTLAYELRVPRLPDQFLDASLTSRKSAWFLAAFRAWSSCASFITCSCLVGKHGTGLGGKAASPTEGGESRRSPGRRGDRAPLRKRANVRLLRPFSASRLGSGLGIWQDRCPQTSSSAPSSLGRKPTPHPPGCASFSDSRAGAGSHGSEPAAA
jgi:hypothetical protein